MLINWLYVLSRNRNSSLFYLKTHSNVQCAEGGLHHGLNEALRVNDQSTKKTVVKKVFYSDIIT